MSESNVSFAKIVANPSIYSWSQAYNAGKLFAVLSLETQEETEEKDYLNVLGKEVLDTLEQEFFTLEVKDLDSIKQAVLKTSEKIPEGVILSFVACSFVNNILYVYILGNGKVILKREGNLGNLLESVDQKANSLKASSGFLQDGDVIILQTRQFSDVISITTLSEFLDNLPPQDAAENLAPLVHEKEEAGAAAIIIAYKSPDPKEEAISLDKREEEIGDVSEEHLPTSLNTSHIKRGFNALDKIKPLFAKIRFSKDLEFNHSRKVILTIVAIIIVVFAGSVIFAVKKQQDAKTVALFNKIYPEASKKYEEGQGLLDLNQNLARDSLNKAKQILDGGKDKFSKNSTEEKKILELLTKVNSSLNSSSGIKEGSAKEVGATSSFFLSAQLKNTANYFSYDDKNIYGLTADSVFSLDTNGGNKKDIIKNNNSWQQAIALFPYFGNIYVLDKTQNQILKFVESSSGFSETNYFSKDVSPNFSKAISLAIDSSIYVLSTDGTIVKFTKGKTDSFSVTSLDTPFKNPTRIYTNINDDNIYVLDNGNSRIVVLDKNGAYKAQYQANIIKSAKDFDVFEKDKKIFVLSSGKIYQIDLK